MADYNKWEVWRARVDFDDGMGSKERPVVIISGEKQIVLALKVTTHNHSGRVRPFEYEIQFCKEAGLDDGSIIQCEKYYHIPCGRMTEHKYGRLSAADIIMVQTMMKFNGL